MVLKDLSRLLKAVAFNTHRALITHKPAQNTYKRPYARADNYVLRGCFNPARFVRIIG